MNKGGSRRFWIFFAISAGGALVLLHGYLFWLGSMVIPFSLPLDLTATGRVYEATLSGFYSDNYFCGISLVIPFEGKRHGIAPPSPEEWLIRRDLDVELDVNVAESTGRTVLHERSSLAKWTLTSAAFFEGPDATLYKPRFDAKLGSSYRLQVRILRGQVSAGQYQPTLFFHGIDRGYFWLERHILNILLAILILVLGLLSAGIRRLIRWRREKVA